MFSLRNHFLILIASFICLPLSLHAAVENTSTKSHTKTGKSKTAVKKIKSAHKAKSTAVNENTNLIDDTPIPENTAPAIGSYLSWQGPYFSALIVGSATAGYSKFSGNYGSFNLLDFNPEIHVSYQDLFLMRSSVDFAIDNQGNTNTTLDNINLNLFLNDYVVFGVGKFDSAIGYFVPNLSPAWINRLPDAPVGFNDQQAAPQADTGIQLRGGFPLSCTTFANYVLYVANGPESFVDTTNSIVDYIATDGFTNNYGNYVFGGRFGFLPIPKLEIGVSAATGKVVLIDVADGTTVLQQGREYHVLGADASYKWKDLELRAEYVQQQIAAQPTSIVTRGEKWKAWYLQAAYWIPTTKWEPVIRYAKFTAPVYGETQQQWDFGIDYWFAPSIAAQAAFELNRGQPASQSNDNLFMIQLAVGF